MVEVRRLSFADLWAAPEFDALLSAYAHECAIDGLPEPDPSREAYEMIELSGAVRVLAAFAGTELIGMLVLLLTLNPHYGVTIGVVESYFVGRLHRETGAGLMLLRRAEDEARDAGAVGLLVSAPEGGKLARVMPRQGYRQTNVVFFRGLA